MEVETNVEEQVETPEVIQEETLTNDTELSQEEARYNKAFEEMDLDDPDTSAFGEQTNVMESPEATIPEDKIVEEAAIENDTIDPFAVDDDGYLVRPLVDRGREVRVTPQELFEFGNKGTNYESKNAEMKPFKEFVNVLKKNSNISIEDLTSLADLANGKKEALKHLIAKYDVDVYDVDSSEEKYTPDTKQYNSDPVADVWSDYQQQNPEGSEVVATAFNTMDEEFRQEVYNEKTFPLFADDVNKGIFDKLYPETMKIKSLYPQASWLEAYSEANNRYTQSLQKKKQVPSHIDAPKDLGSNASPSGTADSIWDDPEVYDRMHRELEY